MSGKVPVVGSGLGAAAPRRDGFYYPEGGRGARCGGGDVCGGCDLAGEGNAAGSPLIYTDEH